MIALLWKDCLGQNWGRLTIVTPAFENMFQLWRNYFNLNMCCLAALFQYIYMIAVLNFHFYGKRSLMYGVITCKYLIFFLVTFCDICCGLMKCPCFSSEYLPVDDTDAERMHLFPDTLEGFGYHFNEGI